MLFTPSEEGEFLDALAFRINRYEDYAAVVMTGEAVTARQALAH